ncbi:uncharacterized protein CLIB1444_01S07250 [[Candida] jaroonii]|uniref:Uncharacterized protein n=1 Tax=[Candida] jaroonii TaxID=467808 RepID=A0ACA9Y0K9_9ASCO|nr:uncharacterized protein CLIB1444_01S07250 [[Candida] jaroonii]
MPSDNISFGEEIPLDNLNKSDPRDDNMNDDISDGTMQGQDNLPEDPLLDEEIQRLQDDQSKVKIFFKKLWNGPDEIKDEPPEPFSKGILYHIEQVPQKFDQRVRHRYKVAILIGYLLAWFLIVYNILSPYFTEPPGVVGGDIQVVSLGCTSQLWNGKNAACGLNGMDCPNSQTDDIFVRCPALCDRSWTYSLEPIGDQRIRYQGYFVGGGDKVSNPVKDQLSNPYRADSYICGSAVHAGIISPFTGGCARVSYKSGAQSGFESAKGHYGVDDSISFQSFFPSSFFFKKITSGFSSNEYVHGCSDPRLPILITNIILGLPIVYLASGPVIYWVITIVGFWTIALATDPPVNVDSNDLETYASLLSIGLERFLPSCFILYALWRASTSITLGKSDSPVSHLSRVFYFYPLFWLGVLNNISFDRLPVDRFTLNDLKTQPGGAIAVACIVSLVLVCAVIQAFKIWESGKFKKYLGIYGCFVLGLFWISQLPGLTLRVHHYILAMLLIPGCCTRGVTALLFQGILLGLFLSGAARWGLAAIAETDTSLRRNDPSGKILPPELLGFDLASGLLSWTDPSSDRNRLYKGISILINDVERFVGQNISSVNLPQLFQNSTELTNLIQQTLDSKFVVDNENIPLYIRIGKKIMGTHRYSDYSNAAILKWPSGELTLPKPGIT